MIALFIFFCILRAFATGAAASPFVTGPAGYLKNIEFIFNGYDIMKGNPLPVNADVDPGYKAAIFGLHYTTGNQIPGSQYMEPDGVDVSDCSGSCRGSSQINAIATSSAYSQTLTKVTTSNFHSWFNAYSASNSYKSVHSSTSSGDSVFTVEHGICCAYSMTNQLGFDGANLTDTFLSWLNHLPATYNQDLYSQFTEMFGTHYVTQLQMGSMYGYQKQYKTETWNSMTQTQKQSTNAWNAAVFGIGGGGSSSNGVATNTAHSQTNTATSTDVISIGAPPGGSLATWLNSAKTTPMPVSATLAPIAELLTNWQMDGLWGDVSLAHREAVQANLNIFNDYYCSTGVTGTCNANPNVLTTDDTSAGTWGGSCTCPDGSVYWVGDKGSACDYLACEGGVSGQCNQQSGKWNYRSVVCNGEKNIVTKGAPGTGVYWGGTCTCPDATTYWVNNMNQADGSCGSMACENGMSGSCVTENVPVKNTKVSCQGFSDTILEYQNTTVGTWGGSCVCPNGGIYWVGDNMDSCGSLACVGGVSGTCTKEAGKWSRRKVICDTSDGKTTGAVSATCEKCPMGQCDRDENYQCQIYGATAGPPGFHCKLRQGQTCEYSDCFQSGGNTYFKWLNTSADLTAIPCFGENSYSEPQAALQEGSVGAPESVQTLDLAGQIVTLDLTDNPVVSFFACVGLVAALIELFRLSARCCKKEETYREVVSEEE